MHGPCGTTKKDNVCIVKGKCLKKIFKLKNTKTAIDAKDFPAYRCHIDESLVEKNRFKLDN